MGFRQIVSRALWAAAALVVVFPLVAVAADPQGHLSACLDDQNQPITSCTRCIWRRGCEWCPDRPSPSHPAVGCIKTSGSYRCQADTIAPGSTKAEIVRDAQLGDRFQIRPLDVDLRLNPNVPSVVEFQAALVNYPVDIYFVMDLSWSMSMHRDNLVEAADRIAVRIRELTPNYQIGFGSFVDKPTAPFAAEKPYYVKNNKSVPYAFQHRMKLTKDTDLFRKRVASADLAANLDSPEAGLDALMQAIVCKEVIGWREEARKIVVFLTDENSHYAMDGVLGGIVKPVPDACQVRQRDPNDDIFYYEAELEYDYVSFSRIREKLSETGIVVVFAVNREMDAIYRIMSHFLQGTENVGHLTKNPSSLEDIIVDQYKSIRSRMVLQTSHPGSVSSSTSSSAGPLVDTDLTASCPNFLRNRQEGLDICSDVRERQEVRFNMTFAVKESVCLQFQDQDDDDSGMVVRVQLAGLPQQRLMIRYRCEECRCAEPVVPSAPQCNSAGDLVCGGCECREGFSGKQCECGVALDRSGNPVKDRCRLQQDSSSLLECSGHGRCSCGSCRCDPGFFGEFCQHSQDQCPHDSAAGTVCSGHGTCTVAASDDPEGGVPRCACDRGWTGDDCSCSEDPRACRDRFTSGSVCFDRGQCRCGRCLCSAGFSGKFCQRHQDLDTCTKLEPCVRLHEFGSPASGGGVTGSAAAAAADPLEDLWRDECEANTNFYGAAGGPSRRGPPGPVKLFGQIINRGCSLASGQEGPLLASTNGTGGPEAAVAPDRSEGPRPAAAAESAAALGMDLIVDLNSEHRSCASVMEEYLRHEAGLSSSSSSSEDDLPVRGDLAAGTSDGGSLVRKVRTEGRTRCTMFHEGCEVTFFHDNLEADDRYDPLVAVQEIGKVYVVYRNTTPQADVWTPLVRCTAIPMALVLGTSIGGFFLICLGLLVAAIIVVNLNDLRDYRRHLELAEANELKLGNCQNPLYQNPMGATTFQNPAFRRHK